MSKLFEYLLNISFQVDHVHKARTVVRSGGLNFDWDERFQLDLLNNMEVIIITASITAIIIIIIDRWNSSSILGTPN